MDFSWFAISALSLIIIFIFSAFITYLITGQTINLSLLGELSNSPNLGILPAWLFSLFNSGIGEEVGWRGFVLPKLQKSRSALNSTIILSIIWAFWHLPFFFYVPGYMKWGIISFPGVILGLVIGGIILTWLYNSTKGSILAVAMWHASFDFTTTSKGAPELVSILVSVIILIWGIILLFIYKPNNLSSGQRQKIDSI